MANLVGIFAASHGPLIVRDWDKVAPDRKTRLTAAMRELGRRLDAAEADVVIAISPDHWVNFFIDNLPSVCIGVGAEHEGPPEPFLKDFPHKTLAGEPALAKHILATALADGFEPSISHRLTLDHGFCIPLWRMELKRMPRLIPFIVNVLEPPMISTRRALEWGRLLSRAVGSYPGDLRVAILATGGLSHSIGEPTMGEIDEPFDRDCIRLFSAGDEGPLCDYLEAALPRTGNGAQEVRNWVVAHGAAGARGFEAIDYLPVPEVYVGCGFAAWRAGG
ncbi:MAG TPA: 2,3-dihydroxyphenylpropionate 1,2-dioxygenase [Alphaproteobacteria bacterium]